MVRSVKEYLVLQRLESVPVVIIDPLIVKKSIPIFVSIVESNLPTLGFEDIEWDILN